MGQQRLPARLAGPAKVSVQARRLRREGRSHPWWPPMFCSTLETAGRLVTLKQRGRRRESEDLQRLPLFRPRMRAQPHSVRQTGGRPDGPCDEADLCRAYHGSFRGGRETTSVEASNHAEGR